MKGYKMTQSNTRGSKGSKASARKVSAPKAPKAQEKPAFVLAPITPDTASQVAKGFAKAVKSVEGASLTFLQTCLKTALLIGCPITAGQYDRQIAPQVREVFNGPGMRHLAETTRASYRSRLKGFCLAVNSGLPEMTPVAGETLGTFLARVTEPLAQSKLADGRRVWDTAKAGVSPKTAPANKGTGKASVPSKGVPASAGTAADAEGGTNEAPMAAAARILARGNAKRAERFLAIAQTFGDEFDRWADGILEMSRRAKAA